MGVFSMFGGLKASGSSGVSDGISVSLTEYNLKSGSLSIQGLEEVLPIGHVCSKKTPFTLHVEGVGDVRFTDSHLLWMKHQTGEVQTGLRAWMEKHLAEDGEPLLNSWVALK